MFLCKSSDASKGILFYSAVFSVVLFSEVQLLGAEGILDVEPAVERQRLRSDLLRNYYDRRPVSGKTVAVLFDVHHILGLDERDQILSVNGILSMSWTDPSLTWDPNSYSDISFVRLPPGEVWLPELQAAFNVRPMKIYDKVRSPPVSVSSNGSVRWYPQVRFDIPCSADYRHYPFDSHSCPLLLVDDAPDSLGLVLFTDWRPSTPSRSVQGTEWVLKDVVHAVQVVQQKPLLQRVSVSIHLERMSRMYRYVCVIPTMVAMLTLLCGFWLLPDETTRYVIGCANVVVLSMLLQHLASTVPAGKVVPLIAQYSASCLCLSAIFVVVTVVNNLLRTTKGVAPSSLVRLAHLSLNRYLCLFVFSHVSCKDRISEATLPESIASSPDELKRRNDWFLVSVLVDRVAFWCFAFVFVVLLAVLAAV